MTQTEAKKTDGKIENPPDCKTKGNCPCNVFERCRKRRPYGSDVWGSPKNKAQAMGIIAFDGGDKITDRGRLNKMLQDLMDRNQKRAAEGQKFNKFFGNVYSATGTYNSALVLPETTDLEITNQMEKLKASLRNVAVFTDFQKSMIIRANLVRNGLMLKSDIYEGETFGSNDLVPYPFAKGVMNEMWAIDHVQIRAKGGCNRFCNAGVLKFGVNSSKGDDGPGCPCVTALRGKDPNLRPFDPHPKEGGYFLFVCVTYNRNQDEGEPPKELPGICGPEKLCNLDDPRGCRRAHAPIVTVFKE